MPVRREAVHIIVGLLLAIGARFQADPSAVSMQNSRCYG
jgi:hypothetical protein